MQVPLDVSFHDFEHSDWAENEIRARVAKLEKLFDHMTSCRVRVEMRAKHKNETAPPVVHIEVGIPGGKNVVVSPEPDHLQRKFQTPDLHNAIHDAFHTAERQLVEIKNKRKQRTKQPQHDAENQFLGQVSEVFPTADHGFLLNNAGSSLYFHRNAMLTGDFDRLKRGDELHYVEAIGDSGPIATKVRLKANGHA